MPKVSIIVPNYNHAFFLKQRLVSIFNQSYQDYEVILLDDCSTDDSREILEHYRNHPKVSAILLNEKNSGSPFKQWEKGTQISKGKLIWIAESDDYCETNFLEILVSKLDQYPKAGVVYCQSVSIDAENKVIGNWIEHTNIFKPNIWYNSFYINGISAIKSFFWYRNIIPNTSALIFRKKIFELTSGFETGMKLNGDWFFWIKMLEKSDLIFIAENLNYFRQHENKVTVSHSVTFEAIHERFIISNFLKRIGLTRPQRGVLTFTMLQMMLYRIKMSGMKENVKGISILIKQLFQFNPYFIFQIFPVVYDHLIRKFKKERHNREISIQKDVIQYSEFF